MKNSAYALKTLRQRERNEYAAGVRAIFMNFML
jgi:hypothetical protein